MDVQDAEGKGGLGVVRGHWGRWLAIECLGMHMFYRAFFYGLGKLGHL
jgi:hypothetical protein